MKSRIIIISAVNLTSGGPLTILRDCLSFLSSSPLSRSFKIVALVHDKKLAEFQNIHYIEFPKSKKHWINRVFYEYIYFSKLSHKYDPFLWLSLHDITPSVKAVRRVVYMHNSIIINHLSLLDWKFDKTYMLFTLFYKYLYRINIHKNNFCIVQQNWFRDTIAHTFGINKDRIIVARPVSRDNSIRLTTNRPSHCHTFFYPSLSRPFKNFEIICQAVEILNEEGIKDFKVVLTIDGTESKYSKWVFNKYRNIPHIEFVGLLSKTQMDEQYNRTDCLIFPSRLETWGLPISEYGHYNRPMILADKPYAREAAMGCSTVAFFDVNDPSRLALLIKQAIEGNYAEFSLVPDIDISDPKANNWQELFHILLK